jgi:hypothetical protein
MLRLDRLAGEFAVRLGSESHRSRVVESGADRGSVLGCPFVLKVPALRDLVPGSW